LRRRDLAELAQLLAEVLLDADAVGDVADQDGETGGVRRASPEGALDVKGRPIGALREQFHRVN